jgi:hypothetical protein
MRSPQGEQVSTKELPSRYSNFEPSSSFFTPVRRCIRLSRSGTTMPVVPRRFCGLPVGKWNWLRPTLIHMLLVLTMMKGSRVRPSPAT